MKRYLITILYLCCACSRVLADSPSGELEVRFEPADPWLLNIDRLAMAQQYPEQLSTLPTLKLGLHSAGPTLLPADPLPLASAHPLWQFIAGTGEWARDGDGGLVLRLPLTLIERGANCLHYGVLRVQFAAGDDSGSAELAIASQTCEYLKFSASYRGSARWQVAAAAERTPHRAAFPVASMAQLQRRHGIDPAALVPPQGVSSAHLTVAGLLYRGRHYQSACGTPWGDYPWCERLPLPTFSLSKSLLAAVAMMRLEQLAPGSAERSIGELLPECGASWQGVSIRQAINMQTGHYSDPGYFEDEDAAISSPLFVAPGHREKLAWACSAYPRREIAGERWVYQTSATYIAVSAMTEVLRELRPEADLYRDLLYRDSWAELPASPLLAFTRRTEDPRAQPFGGWGQVVTADDLLLLGRWLQREAAAPALLAPSLLRPALRPAGDAPGVTTGVEGLRYLHGFWLLEVGGTLGCEAPHWLPFLSGHGGITLALLDEETLYYYVSDNNEYRWMSAVQAVHRQRPLCQ